jgi:transcription elongation factor GreA
MVTLEELNLLRQKEQWKEVLEKTREHLKSDPEEIYALRALVQSLDHLDYINEEYEAALLRLMDLNDRIIDSAQKLSKFYKKNGEKKEAVRYLEIGLENAIAERQYDSVEALWLEMSEIETGNVEFYILMSQKLQDIKQHQRAAILIQMLLPSFEERKDWAGQFQLLKRILVLTPKDKSLRDPIIDTLKKLHALPHMDSVLDYSGIRKDRPILEALEDVELFMNFLPASFLRHPDWGIGKVKDLDISKHIVLINFQRKRNHKMNVELAKKAVEPLAEEDFRVQKVINSEALLKKLRDEPVEFIKNVLKSFGGAMAAKDIKENLVPDVINVREWTTWWSKTNSAMRRDPFISVSGGSVKKYTLRDQESSDEEELLKRFDETKAPNTKVDQINEYIRTTKKADMQEHVIQHFSKKLKSLAPRRRSKSERVELWLTNEGLKKYSEKIESMPQELMDDTIHDAKKAIRIIQKLRFKAHQWLYAKRFLEIHHEDWPVIFQQLLLEPDIMIRDELANTLKKSDHENLIISVVEKMIADFRKYSPTFIWVAGQILIKGQTWLEGKISNALIVERLLLLVDYLTSQAKRRDKDESLWLRKVAGDARDLIRKDRYSLFKENIKDADVSVAQSIYRRAQTNEGFDSRTATDLTTILRARFPSISAAGKDEDQSIIPQGMLCLKLSYEKKQALFKRLVEFDLPEVLREIEIARQHGDLKENAEYHAARDKQKLLASQTGELEESLHKAQIIDLNQVEYDVINFGSCFSITPIETEAIDEYILLGPWESHPEVKILSYQAPFAAAFVGKKVGDEVDIELPTHTGRYEVISIKRIPDETLKNVLTEEQISQNKSNAEKAKQESQVTG